MSMTVGELVAYLDLEDKEYHRKLGAAEREATGFGTRVGGTFGKLGKFALGAAVGGVALLGAGLAAGAVAGMKFNSSIEQTTIAMGTMLGSTAKAKTLIGEVTKMAAATPFEFPELADATKKLVAYGVAAKDAVPLMTRLGDISSALAIPIGEVADLYGKMKVSGRITMEDINQMAGRGIPIYGALAKVLGKGQDEIRGLVETGKIGFPDVEKAFVSLTDKGSMFGGMMDKQSRSFAGLWSTIKDSVIQVFAMVVKPGFDWLVKEGLPKAIKLVGKFSDGFKKGGLEGGLKRIMDPKTAGQIVDTLGTVKDIVFTIGGAILAVSKVFISLPGDIKKVIIAVGLLAVAMKALSIPIPLPGKGGKGGIPGGAPVPVVGTGLLVRGLGFLGGAAGGVIPVFIAGIGAGVIVQSKTKPEGPAALQAARTGVNYGRMVGTGQQNLKFSADTRLADAAIAELEARADRLRARIAERMEAGKLNNDKWLDKLDQTQGRIDVLRDTVHDPMRAGHLQNQPWNTSIGGSQDKLEYFRSLTQSSMAVGHIDTSAATSAFAIVRQQYQFMKDYIDLHPISLHVSTVRTGSSSGGKGPATGGITTGPLSGYTATLHGTEAVIPLNGNRYTPNRVYDYGGSNGPAPALRPVAATSTVNVNVVVPGGTTLIGTAREVGEILAPHVARALGRANDRAGRRR